MKRITLSRFPAWLSAIFLVLGIACNRENPDPVSSDPAVTLTRPDQTYQATDLFYQSQYITNALALEPRSSDGMLMFSFSTNYSNTSFRYAAPPLENPTPTLSSTDNMDKVQSRRQVADVDGGRAFHAEATHFDALGVDDDNAGIAFIIIRGDGQMVSRWIGGDGHLERFFIDIGQLRHIRQNVRVGVTSSVRPQGRRASPRRRR